MRKGFYSRRVEDIWKKGLERARNTESCFFNIVICYTGVPYCVFTQAGGFAEEKKC